MSVPANPKIYHIVHVDRLKSIVEDGCLWSDSEVERRGLAGTGIGMNKIKRRRMEELTLNSHPELHVGECVPFYFCPRSVMLYIISRGNHEELDYKGGQRDIVHLESDLHRAVEWAIKNRRRWAFTLQNAGSCYFEDRTDLDDLDQIDWNAVRSVSWQNCIDKKQAEFLLERSCPWNLIERIGVHTKGIFDQVQQTLERTQHKPIVEVKRDWYY
ncbi:MAG: DUF4433 domain-containing protein [Verrucomicrobiota bacterium]